MSTINLPDSFSVSQFNLMSKTNQRVGAAPFGGSEQAIDLLNDRWTCTLEVPMKSYAEAAGIEAFIASMRGQTNTVDLGHYARTVPNGTARGTLTMSGAASQGAASISVTGVSPSSGTFLAGDMLGLTTTAGAKLLVMVASDCTAAGGSVTVPLANRLRANVASGSSVVWSFPKVPFRIIGTSGVKYVPFVAESVSFDFGEVV